ncbi:BA75_00750T0 [Komagataella pastoris]|uniref:Ubiquitin-like modifier-activating enzyme ATG7 n=1 Tax=Komagataella pastoris TaxID=4922 RepID=A0A1B2J872_PICPA|nr:BA75_00750T0 [Komagataella pastoris]
MTSMDIPYSQISSFVNSSFFQKLSQLKLNKYKLDDTDKAIVGSVDFKFIGKNQPTSLSVDESSFSDNITYTQAQFPVKGILKNLNTVEDFRKVDKNEFLQSQGLVVHNSIQDRSCLKDLSKLTRFFILSFSDLKGFKFIYWFGFPSLVSKWKVNKLIGLSESQIEPYETKLNEWLSAQLPIEQKQAFIIDGLDFKSFDQLSSFSPRDQLIIGFIDTSSIPNKCSTQLRNILYMLACYGYENIKVYNFRFNNTTSFTLDITLAEPLPFQPKTTGWERTAQGKLGPKLADIGALVDPARLADQSVDLNLKLMKWRVMPELDLDIIKNSKVLLLGAGTLGSYVSRVLLGYGVRHITFVDNGKVSFSNPVRQPLFNFTDCLEGGAPKAETAAKALKSIFPLITSQGYNLEVPMAGHPVTDEKKQYEDYQKLVTLIKEHDAVFLLMDSRETRWLPTVLCNVFDKICITAALGFDSYLVMRHGSLFNTENLEAEENSHRLGCYFCNDIIAPKDSTTDRTLDQMCTVTRPGVALLASSLAAELFVSILQHPLKSHAPASLHDNATVLGCLPQQLRGFLHNFETSKLEANNYEYCSACSIQVLNEYKSRTWDFVKDALNENNYLEDLTGLTKVKQESEIAEKKIQEFEHGLEFSDEDSEWIN